MRHQRSGRPFLVRDRSPSREQRGNNVTAPRRPEIQKSRDDKINRTCVAGNRDLCHVTRMAAFFRFFLALLLSVTLLGATAFEASANLTAEIAAPAEPCCEGNCPDDPACEASCTMVQRCGTGMTALLQTSQPKTMDTPKVATPFPDVHSPPRGLSPHGLKRPPRI